jgi:rod shape determining protein RodA
VVFGAAPRAAGVLAGPGAAGRSYRAARTGRGAGVDWVLLLAVVGLCLAGAASVYAATRNSLLVQHRNPMAYLQRDLLNDAVGLLIAVPVAWLPGRVLRSCVRGFYALVVLLLIVVLVPGIGSVINGARAWFSLGVAQLEPSEFAKIAVVAVLAELLARRQDNTEHPAHRDVILALLTVAVPLVLILAEPALGIAIIVALSALVALSIGGAPSRWVVGLLMLGVIGGAGAFQVHLLKPYQEQRFTAFTDPNSVTTPIGYQLHQSINGGFVPEQQTDFVFTVVGEEGGFVACAGLLAGFAVVFLRGLRIARRASDPFAQVLAAGLVSWFAFQTFINVGMTVGLMPVTGVPLPFVSYGGSAIFAELLGVALLIGIGRDTARRPVQ